MAIHPGLRRRCGVGPHEASVALRQVHDEEMGLLFDAINDNDRLAEIGLCMSRGMRQRHEHLLSAPLALPDVVLDDCVAAGEPMLITKPIEDALGGVPLLAMHRLVAIEPRIDDLGKPIQLRPLDRCRSPIARRHREGQGLLHRITRDVEMGCCRTLAHAVGAGQTNLSI